MAPLVEREDVIAIGEVQADEVPRVSRLVAAVQQQDLRLPRLAPLRKVEALASHDRVARHIAHVGCVRDAQIGGALEETGELGKRVMSRGERVSANSLRYMAYIALKWGMTCSPQMRMVLSCLVLRECSHLDEAHHVVDACIGQSLHVVDRRVGVAERVVEVVQATTRPWRGRSPRATAA